jgi:hypothetical protein
MSVVGEQAQVGEIMKRKNIFISMLLAFLMLVIGAGVASARAIGDGYTLAGIQIGIVCIILAVVLGLVIIAGILEKKYFGTISIALLLIGVLFIVPISIPEEPITVVPDGCPFTLTASAVTTGTNYIGTSTWNSATNTLTVPLTVSNSTDGNLSAHKFGLNITVNPMCPGALSTQIEVFTFSSDYAMTYGGEKVLRQDSTGYMAIWTTDSDNEYYDTTLKVTADSTDWAQIDYTTINGTAGGWVTELSQVGDSLSWNIHVGNEYQTEVITVNAIVVAYTE